MARPLQEAALDVLHHIAEPADASTTNGAGSSSLSRTVARPGVDVNLREDSMSAPAPDSAALRQYTVDLVTSSTTADS